MFASIIATLLTPAPRKVAPANDEMIRCSSATCSLCNGMKKEGDFEFSHFILQY